MIPILFPANAADYDSNGIGPLADATSCSVTEELNGAYQLKMTLPRSSPRLAEIAVGMQILAAPNPFDQAQPFRIINVNKRLRGEIEITAPHLVYDLRRCPIGALSATYTSLKAAVAAIQGAQLATENLFNFITPERDATASPGMKVEGPAYIWDLLGNGENTFVGTFKDDLKFDRRDIHFLLHRGANYNKYVIRYGSNMTDLTYETEGEDAYSAVLPVWKSGSTTVVGDVMRSRTIPPVGSHEPPVILHTPNSERVMIVDLSSSFSSKPSVSDLDVAAAQRWTNGHTPNAPEIRVKVTAVPPGSRGLKTLEEVLLGDTIRIEHEGLNVNVSARVVQTVYDVLRDRYTSFDVEGRVYGVATTIAKIGKQVKTGRVAY